MKSTAAISGGLIVAIIAFITPFEGERHTAYLDPVGIPTVCMGETKGVYIGMRRTHEQCVDMLKKRVPSFLNSVDKLMPSLTDNQRIAYTDAAYNLGAGALTQRTKTCPKNKPKCKKDQMIEIAGTSIVDLQNSGKKREACDRLLKFEYAGGKKLKGLVERREKERELCLKDLS